MAEKVYLRCECCGKCTERRSGTQRFCPECAIWQKKKRYLCSKPREKKLEPAENRHCERCGQKIENARGNQRFCHDCAAAAYRERRMEERKKCAEPETPTEEKCTSLPPAAVPWSLAGKSADQVEVEARALGLSYGQYSAFCSTGMMEQYCRARGVDGDKETKKAWREFRQHQKLLHEGRSKQHTSSGTA